MIEQHSWPRQMCE